MNIKSAMIMAPRQTSTIRKCAKSIGLYTTVFAEPNCPDLFFVNRPCTIAPLTEDIVPSPEGVFGNFQNWIQAARDILVTAEASDAVLIAEDDALFTPGIATLLKRDLWPSEQCGCVSLYCPKMSTYRQILPGINLTDIKRPEIMGRSGNLVGALALVFPATVLKELVYHPSVAEWKGSHKQSETPSTKPWERKSVDTWIGRTLVETGRTIWHYSPSLVLHYEPIPKHSNSSLGHSSAARTRQARSFVGESPKDLLKLMKQRLSRYDIPANPDPNVQSL